MKTDPSIIYMVPDHKQIVLRMRYQEVQVEYFGKRHEFVDNYVDKVES